MDHPADTQRELLTGVVIAVHAATWEVDVRVQNSSSAIVRRVKVVSHFLPEVHSQERPSKVILGRVDGYQQAPVAIPIHDVIIPDQEKADHVLWLELHGLRMKIREPGHQGVLRPDDQVGELEIRSLKGGRLLQWRMQEPEGVIRSDTPTTHVVLNDNDEKVEVHADGDVVVDAGGDIKATAGGDIDAQAVGSASVQAGADISLRAGGNITLAATGAVVITGATIALN